MPVTDDKKGPIEHTLDVFVYLPLGFVLELPGSIPHYIDRGRRELSPRRLLSRGGRSALPSLSDAGRHLSRLQEQTHSTLRALGVTAPGTSAADASTANRGRAGAPTSPGGSQGNGHRPVPDASAAAASAPAVTTPPVADHATEAPGGAEPAVDAAPGLPAPDPSTLAITDYDSLSASQVVPRLDSLAVDELEGIRVYEAATRGRKTILNKIAQLQSA